MNIKRWIPVFGTPWTIVYKSKKKVNTKILAGLMHRMINPKFDFGVTLSHVTTITVVKNVSSETVNCTQTKVIHVSSTSNRRSKWLEKFPMDGDNNAEWIYIWWWLNLVTVFTTKLLLRSLFRIFPIDDLEDLEDLSSWGSWETFLLRIFPLEDIFSWGSFFLRIHI